MFEGWAADLLATSLGKFADVQRDQLRISLWSGAYGRRRGRQLRLQTSVQGCCRARCLLHLLRPSPTLSAVHCEPRRTHNAPRTPPP
jgi:hypothetical protein